MTSQSLFGRILNLSRFDGDSSGALRAVRDHFSAELPDCSVALLLVRDQPAGSCRLAGLIGADGTEHVPNIDPYNLLGELPLFDDTLAAQIVAANTAHALPVSAAQRQLPLAQALLKPAAVLVIPIANSGHLTHWLIFASAQPGHFDHVDLERMLLHTNLATSLIVRPLALRELTRETQRQRREIESLADIQKLLLPDDPPIAGLEYATYWQPAETAAGDYYELSNLTQRAPDDFPRDGADVWGMMIGDVSGHGAAAAMEAVQFDAILRTYRGGGEPQPQPQPAAVVSYGNRYFMSRRTRGRFMTLFAIVYRPDTRLLHYVSAGHPPMLLRRGDEVRLFGEADQIPLGVLRDHDYHNNELALETGDLLVLYTDGLIEARDRQTTPFGLERLRTIVSNGPSAPDELRDSIMSAVQAHQGGQLGSDDQTLIVLKIAH